MSANGWNGHGALVGGTGSGKTYLAKKMAEAYKVSRPVIVFDPMENGYPGSYVTSDFDAFILQAKNHKQCALFIDESSEVSKHPDFNWCFTIARNLGHESNFISQRHTQVPPIIRENVERLYLFKCSDKSAQNWAEEFAMPEILMLQAERYPRYHFIEAYRNEAPQGRQMCQISKA